MRNVFNSKTASLVVAQEKIKVEKEPLVDPGDIFSRKERADSDPAEPVLPNGVPLKEFLDTVATNKGIAKQALDILRLVGPRTKQKRELNRRRASKRAERILIQAAKWDEGLNEETAWAARDLTENLAARPWFDVDDPDPDSSEDDLLTRAERETNFSADRDLYPTGVGILGEYDNDNPRVIPLTGIFSKPDSSSDESFRIPITSNEPVENARKPCDNPDCSHHVKDLLTDLGLSTASIDPNDQICDSNKTVCEGCENLPILQGDICPTCAREGTITEDEAGKQKNIYDPLAKIVRSTAQAMSDPGIPADTYALPDAGAQPETGFGTGQPDTTDFMHTYDALSGSFDSVDPVDPDDLASLPDYVKVNQPEVQESPVIQQGYIEDDETNPVQKYITFRPEIQRHSRECPLECNNGSLVGSSNPKAIERIRSIKNSEDYHKALAKAVKSVKSDSRIPPEYLASHLADTISSVDRLFFTCPNAV